MESDVRGRQWQRSRCQQVDKHDDSADEHLVSLLKTIKAHEEEEGKKIDAQVVTWRGMMTKVS